MGEQGEPTSPLPCLPQDAVRPLRSFEGKGVPWGPCESEACVNFRFQLLTRYVNGTSTTYFNGMGSERGGLANVPELEAGSGLARVQDHFPIGQVEDACCGVLHRQRQVWRI